MTDARVKDLEGKIAEIEGLLASDAPAEELFQCSERTSLALEVRGTDERLGLDPVPDELVEKAQARAASARALAAAKGHLEATFRVVQDAWVSQEPTRAKAAAELAAKVPSDPRIEYLLGLFFFHGLGVPQDLVECRRRHEIAAEGGNGDAMFELYAMTAQGLGCEADPDSAFVWCKRAAEAGNTRAMANMGGFYATGRFVEMDEETSIYWYDTAAQRGHGKAAATLGVMYLGGQGAPKSAEKARQYFELAENNGFDWRSFTAMVGVDLSELEGKKKREPAKKAAAKKAPAKKAQAKKVPAKTAPTKKAASAKTAPTKKTPAKKAAPAKKAPQKSTKRGS